MHIKNRLPLLYIINECATKDKKTGKFTIKPKHMQWIISYANFLSASKYGYNIFDIEILNELNENNIEKTIKDMIACPLSSNEIFKQLPESTKKCLNKTRWEYIHNQKPFWDTKDEWIKFFSSIKEWFK